MLSCVLLENENIFPEQLLVVESRWNIHIAAVHTQRCEHGAAFVLIFLVSSSSSTYFSSKGAYWNMDSAVQ